MTLSQSAPVRKAVAVGLAIAALLLVLLLVVEPAVGRMQHVEREIEAKRALMARLSELAARTRQAGSASTTSNEAGVAAWMIAGDTESLQLAELQSRLGALSDRAGVRPQLTRTLQAAQHEGVPVVGVQMTYQIAIDALQRLLHLIETHKPALIVDALSVQPVLGAVPASAESRQLQVDLRILAPVRTGKRGPGP